MDPRITESISPVSRIAMVDGYETPFGDASADSGTNYAETPPSRARRKKPRSKKQAAWGKRFGRAVRACKRTTKGKGKQFNLCMRRKLK